MTELDAALNALRSDAPKTKRVTVRLTANDYAALEQLGAITGRTITAAAETLLAISVGRVRDRMDAEQLAGRLHSWTPTQFIERDFIGEEGADTVQ